MRVSVTISEEINNYLVELAKEKNISKDKLIGSILIDYVNKDQVKNPRGAGRKSRFDEKEIFNILSDRDIGMSIRSIASKYNCSAGLIHKIINEHDDQKNKDMLLELRKGLIEKGVAPQSIIDWVKDNDI